MHEFTCKKKKCIFFFSFRGGCVGLVAEELGDNVTQNFSSVSPPSPKVLEGW